MKRLSLTLLCFLFFCGIADARMLQGVAGAVSSLSCSSTTNQMETYTSNGTTNFANSSATVWKTTMFQYGGNTGTFCKLQVEALCSSTGCDQIVTGYLYDNDPTGDGGTSDGVGSLVGTCTGTYNSTDLDTTPIFIDLTSCSGTLTNGSKYWFVFNADNATGDYLKLSTDSTCSTGEKMGYSSNGSSWTYTTGDCINTKAFILE